MTDEPAEAPLPEEQRDAGEAPRRAFLLHFPRAPVPGTDLTIRSTSVGQDREMWKDASDHELDDREFTVLLVQRQLDQEVDVEAVRSWPDDQLLAAADAFLSLVKRTDRVEGAEEDEEPAEELDSGPATFADVRRGVEEMGLRRARRMKKVIGGIMELSQANTKQIAELVRNNPAFDLRLSAGVTDSIKKIGDLYSSSVLKGIELPELRIASGIKGADLPKFDALYDTKGIGSELTKMLGDQAAAAAKFDLPSASASRSVQREPFFLTPLVSPQVRLLGEVSETLEKMHDDDLRAAENQIEVMVQQTRLLRAQGEALAVLVHDAKGQKWPRRIELAIAIVAAFAAVAAALYASGAVRPLDSAVPAGTPTPIAGTPQAPTATP